jgi:hypothetical protein
LPAFFGSVMLGFAFFPAPSSVMLAGTVLYNIFFAFLCLPCSALEVMLDFAFSPAPSSDCACWAVSFFLLLRDDLVGTAAGKPLGHPAGRNPLAMPLSDRAFLSRYRSVHQLSSTSEAQGPTNRVPTSMSERLCPLKASRLSLLAARWQRVAAPFVQES